MAEWRLKVAEMVAVFWLHTAERGRGRNEGLFLNHLCDPKEKKKEIEPSESHANIVYNYRIYAIGPSSLTELIIFTQSNFK